MYEHNLHNERSVHMVAKFGVFVDEDHCKLSTLYWLSKLHKHSYKSRAILIHILLLSCIYI